jgi:hypothetical protein
MRGFSFGRKSPEEPASTPCSPPVRKGIDGTMRPIDAADFYGPYFLDGEVRRKEFADLFLRREVECCPDRGLPELSGAAGFLIW